MPRISKAADMEKFTTGIANNVYDIIKIYLESH